MAKRHSRAKQRAYLAAQKKNRYNANEAGRLDRIEQAVEAMAGQLDNLIMQNVPLEGENVEMANQKIRRHIELNGKKHWINAATEQEYAEKLQALAMANAPEQPAMKNLNADRHLVKT